MKALILFAILWSLLLCVVEPTAAQTDGGAAHGAGESAPEVRVPDPLTQEAIRELVSELDDAQVRQLLLHRLSEEADRRTEALATQDQRRLGEIAADYARAFGAFIEGVFRKVPDIHRNVAEAFNSFFAKRSGASEWPFFLSLAIVLGGGFFAAFAVRRMEGSVDTWISRARPQRLWARARVLTIRFLFHISRAAAFTLVALAANLLINDAAPADRTAINRIVAAVGWTWVAIAIARFMLAPARPDLRLCAATDRQARFLTFRIGLIATLFNLGFGFTGWMYEQGIDYADHWLGVWVSVLVYGLIIATVWQGRHAVEGILIGSDPKAPGVPPWLAAAWPLVVIVMLVVQLLIAWLLVAISGPDRDVIPRLALTILVLIGSPFIEQAIRAIIASLVPVHTDKAATLQAAERQMQAGLTRVARVTAVALLILFLLYLWDVDLLSLAQQGVGARFADAVIDLLLIVALAYGLCELVKIVADRQIAIEKAMLGLDTTEADDMEGEGGGAGARLGTLLPLVSAAARIVILVLAVMAILSEMGVNVLPLLAGAGVVGLAIGFGAQALVKDIVSGVFFLIDDAFRKGEYIDLGDVKGTVERISIRSMQLRHHTGPLHTIPFGDIRHITNYSRDWVIMKLPLRLTYDTDVEKVRKMIKKLGEQLMADPEIGPQFLQPLKSQGVVQMEDSAMIMRVKFMTRPGDQWTVRRIVFARLRDLFEENGIRFASREVVVRIADEDRQNPLTDEERRQIAGSAARTLADSGDLTEPR